MTTAIILSIIAIIGVLFSITRYGIFQKIISFGLAFSILITWVEDKNILMTSLLLLATFSLLTVIYGFTTKKISKIERFSICVMGLFFAILMLSLIMHWPGTNLIRLGLMVPCITYFTGLVMHKKLVTNETGFMISWMALSVTEIMKIWT